jgi:hypothetical protein
MQMPLKQSEFEVQLTPLPLALFALQVPPLHLKP